MIGEKPLTGLRKKDYVNLCGRRNEHRSIVKWVGREIVVGTVREFERREGLQNSFAVYIKYFT